MSDSSNHYLVEWQCTQRISPNKSNHFSSLYINDKMKHSWQAVLISSPCPPQCDVWQTNDLITSIKQKSNGFGVIAFSFASVAFFIFISTFNREHQRWKKQCAWQKVSAGQRRNTQKCRRKLRQSHLTRNADPGELAKLPLDLTRGRWRAREPHGKRSFERSRKVKTPLERYARWEKRIYLARWRERHYDWRLAVVDVLNLLLSQRLLYPT